jgi:transposase
VIVIGIDAHKRTHTLVAVDDVGVKLGEKTVEATGRGHASALRWAHRKFGAGVLWGVEDSRGVTGLLERDLMAARQRVVRVPPMLMARSRVSARTWGKSDPIDALARRIAGAVPAASPRLETRVAATSCRRPARTWQCPRSSGL